MLEDALKAAKYVVCGAVIGPVVTVAASVLLIAGGARYLAPEETAKHGGFVQEVVKVAKWEITRGSGGRDVAEAALFCGLLGGALAGRVRYLERRKGVRVIPYIF